MIYFFHVHTTIPPKYVVFLYLLFLLCTTIRRRLRVLTYLFFLYAHNHLIKICGPLPFIISFVHDHSTKIRGSFLLCKLYYINYSINCVCISYATFITVLIYFVHYIFGRTALIFRTLWPWLCEVFSILSTTWYRQLYRVELSYTE